MTVLQATDPTLRDQLLGAMLENQNPGFDEARAAVTTAPISSEQKNHVLQIIAAVEAEENQN